MEQVWSTLYPAENTHTHCADIHTKHMCLKTNIIGCAANWANYSTHTCTYVHTSRQTIHARNTLINVMCVAMYKYRVQKNTQMSVCVSVCEAAHTD